MVNHRIEMSLLDTQVCVSSLHSCASILDRPSESLAEKCDLVSFELAQVHVNEEIGEFGVRRHSLIEPQNGRL